MREKPRRSTTTKMKMVEDKKKIVLKGVTIGVTTEFQTEDKGITYRRNSVRMLTLQVQSYRSVIWLAKSGGPTRVPETGIVAHGPKRTGALRTNFRLQSSVCDHLIVPKLPSAQAPTHSPAYSRH